MYFFEERNIMYPLCRDLIEEIMRNVSVEEFVET